MGTVADVFLHEQAHQGSRVGLSRLKVPSGVDADLDGDAGGVALPALAVPGMVGRLVVGQVLDNGVVVHGVVQLTRSSSPAALSR